VAEMDENPSLRGVHGSHGGLLFNMVEERGERGHSEAQPEMHLRELVDQYLANKLGMQGQALIGFILAALLLLRGGWLLTDSPVHRISWFVMGCAMGFSWMVYVATPDAEVTTQLQLAVGISCHLGVLVMLFPGAGCYLIGAGASALAIQLVHASTGASGASGASAAIHMMHVQGGDLETIGLTLLQVVAGILGGCLCSRFSKVSLDFIFSLAGSAVMVLITYWGLNEAFHWCFHSPDPNDSSPLQYWLALWSFPGTPWTLFHRWTFSFTWFVAFWLGQRFRQRLEISEAECLHHRFQEEIRRAPSDCDRVPWSRPQPLIPPGSESHAAQSAPSRTTSPEEEDFGMYLLPEDLESMKRSRSIPCFTPESRPKAKIVALRQSTS